MAFRPLDVGISLRVRQPQFGCLFKIMYGTNPHTLCCSFRLSVSLPIMDRKNPRDAFARWAALGKESPTRHPGCLVHPVLNLPITTHRSVVTAIDIFISRQSPLVGRGFQGTPDLPAIGSWRARKTNKSGADQIWLLTYFAGQPQSHLCVTIHHLSVNDP